MISQPQMHPPLALHSPQRTWHMQHPVKDVIISSAVSAGSAGTSIFVTTLPGVQWLAAVVAVISGSIAIAIGVIKLHSWWKRHK